MTPLWPFSVLNNNLDKPKIFPTFENTTNQVFYHNILVCFAHAFPSPSLKIGQNEPLRQKAKISHQSLILEVICKPFELKIPLEISHLMS